jgi:hypothetical protein
VKFRLKLERRLPKLALDAASGSRAAFGDLTFMRYEMMHFGVRLGLDEADGLSGVYAMQCNLLLEDAVQIGCMRCSCCSYIAIRSLYSLSISIVTSKAY